MPRSKVRETTGTSRVRRMNSNKRSNASFGAMKIARKSMKNGAGDGVRTRDVQLGKLAFYH